MTEFSKNEKQLDNFTINEKDGYVKIVEDSSEDFYVVSPDLFKDKSTEATRLFVRAYHFGQMSKQREVLKALGLNATW